MSSCRSCIFYIQMTPDIGRNMCAREWNGTARALVAGSHNNYHGRLKAHQPHPTSPVPIHWLREHGRHRIRHAHPFRGPIPASAPFPSLLIGCGLSYISTRPQASDAHIIIFCVRPRLVPSIKLGILFQVKMLGIISIPCNGFLSGPCHRIVGIMLGNCRSPILAAAIGGRWVSGSRRRAGGGSGSQCPVDSGDSRVPRKAAWRCLLAVVCG